MAASSDAPVGASVDLNTTEPKIEVEKASEPTTSAQPPATEASTTTNGTNGTNGAPPAPPSLNTTSAISGGKLEQKPTIAAANEDDGVNPIDFQGTVDTNNDLPSAETLRKIENYIVLDRDGKTHTFKSLYTGKHVARRVLVIFVRHFFCGLCQDYLRVVSASISPDALLRLPVSTFIAVIGCGDPGLIDMYTAATDCPFPIYADPTRKLYDELGMVKTLSLGTRPAYSQKHILRSSLASVVQGLKQITTGLVTKAGDQRQIGGEFLFEPYDLQSPVTTPWSESNRMLGANGEDANGRKHSDSLDGKDGSGEFEEKKVTWCHRMKNTRDHAEVPELMEVLGLDGQGLPIEDKKRWSKALEERKGTGLSMARQMSMLRS